MPAAEFTIADVDDAPKLPELFYQIALDDEIAIVSAGIAFDTRKCHGAIAAHSAAAIIQPRKVAKPCKSNTPGCRTQ